MFVTAVESSTLLRIYVVARQPLLGQALCRFFDDEPQLAVAGVSREFDAGAIAKAAPDVVLLDWEDDVEMLADVVVRCRAAAPAARLCVLSRHLSIPFMMRTISAGADGYIINDATPAELISCIKRVGSDGFYADPRLASMLLRDRAKGTVQLTRREADVVRLVAEGLSNKQVAARLGLSDKTVKNHVANVFSKLNVCARTQIVAYAIRNGIV